RPVGADRHERRRFDRPAREAQAATARGAVGGQEVEVHEEPGLGIRDWGFVTGSKLATARSDAWVSLPNDAIFRISNPQSRIPAVRPNQHRIPIRKEAIALFDRMPVGAEDEVA